MAGKPKYTKFEVDLPNDQSLTLYAGQRVRRALEEVTVDMNLYKGVRLAQVLKVVYEQGLKDGRREVIAEMEQIKKHTKYLNPGRPHLKRGRKTAS